MNINPSEVGIAKKFTPSQTKRWGNCDGLGGRPLYDCLQAALKDQDYTPPVNQENHGVTIIKRNGRTQTPNIILGGVGTELKVLLQWWHLYPVPGCQCEDHTSKMDALGVHWCELNTDTIAKWLKIEAERRQIFGFSLANVPGFSMGVHAMIQLAIANAKKKGGVDLQ